MSDDLCWMPATELAGRIRRRELSPVEATQAALDRLEQVNPAINAFVTVTGEQALDSAREAERKLTAVDADTLPPLFGVPVTIKDLEDTAGVRTTYGSLLYRDHVPTVDAVPVARMRAAGAIIVGKTTTPEFGMLGITESRLTGITNNPWNTAVTSGGSSGGAAAAVAAGIAPLAWGSDGGGSIRVPAACCGVVGLKASKGRIPAGASYAWEGVSTSGPLTRTVDDAALLLDVTAGPHADDPHSLPRESPGRFLDAVSAGSAAGLRIAYIPNMGGARVAQSVQSVVSKATTTFADLGAHIDEVSIALPDPVSYFLEYWGPAFAMTVDELRELPGWQDDVLHPRTFDIADAGRGRSAVDYRRTSVELRAEISRGFTSVFADYDLILTPTMTVPAFPHPGPAAGNTEVDGVAVQHPHLDFHRLTEPPSHAGLPALSLCCGFTDTELPVGLQIIGPALADAAVLAAAGAYQDATPWHQMQPPITPPTVSSSMSGRTS